MGEFEHCLYCQRKDTMHRALNAVVLPSEEKWHKFIDVQTISSEIKKKKNFGEFFSRKEKENFHFTWQQFTNSK